MSISRRSLLTAAGTLAATGTLAQPAAMRPTLQLRILETSDLHMFVLDWDYYRAQPDPTVGLAKVASLIAQARGEVTNSLLFDNGDIIQGNPLGDYVATPGKWPQSRPHPMFSAMNQLGYDAATLGNHEFNYGLPFLEQALETANFPFVCANIQRQDGSSYIAPWRVLERDLTDSADTVHRLRIGVIGFLPPQIMIWDRHHLEGQITTSGIVETAQQVIPQLRRACDVLIALSHSGITPGPIGSVGTAENASCQLAFVPGIDAILTGHSHRVFPGPDYRTGGGIDSDRGLLNGVPAVMPGFWGSHLGVIDLDLLHDGTAWRVAKAHAEARPIYARENGSIRSLAPASPLITTSVANAHAEVRAWVDEPVGAFATPVNSYFVWIGHDPASSLVNTAQAAYAKQLLAGTPHADLPILSAAAPFKAGYTPDAYIDLAEGPVALRQVAELYIYPNTLTAVRITGAQVIDWLEHSARAFNRIEAGRSNPQALVDRRVPSYNFDVIAGLTYEIDLTAPARTDRDGKVLDPSSHRIRRVEFNGAVIRPEAIFVLVTNNYRADGGGGFPRGDVILRAPDNNRDVLIDYIRHREPNAVAAASPWRFAPLGQRTTISFKAGHAAARLVSEVPGLRHGTRSEDGFDEFLFDLS